MDCFIHFQTEGFFIEDILCSYVIVVRIILANQKGVRLRQEVNMFSPREYRQHSRVIGREFTFYAANNARS